MINIETFPFLPYGQVEKSNEFLNKTIFFESGKKQKQASSTQPQTTWKFTVSGLNNERLALEAFHDRHKGDFKSFNWIDPDGVQQTVRFQQGKLPIIVKREGMVAVAFQCEISLEKVI